MINCIHQKTGAGDLGSKNLASFISDIKKEIKRMAEPEVRKVEQIKDKSLTSN
jgi:hypothetical protein